jgi:sortase A
MRRLLRWLGTAMILAGIALLAWSFVVWRWEDPFTSLYTRYEQRGLASSYARLEAEYHPPPAAPVSTTSLAASRREVARAARRFRAQAKPGAAIARLEVPRLGLDMVVVDGTDGDTLRKGPARDRRTFMPGQGELVYVAGHRTTYGAPFADIDELRRGDPVSLRLPYATIVYEVTGHVIVPATDLARLKSQGREQLALQACHPRFFASHRYIVYARPVEVRPRRGTPYRVGSTASAAASQAKGK